MYRHSTYRTDASDQGSFAVAWWDIHWFVSLVAFGCHVLWLVCTGYPIVSDPIYNHSAWGPNKGKKGEGITSVDTVRVGYHVSIFKS